MWKLRCLSLFLAAILLLLSSGDAAVVTGICEKDSECGAEMCCAVSIWIKSLRLCTPMGNKGDDCHPLANTIPFMGKRKHYSCPCLPNLACKKTSYLRHSCLPRVKNKDVFLTSYEEEYSQNIKKY
ncbi:hypothetical protein FKM82_004534 [Ascaphus truei]|uniref:prokineticin-2 n=1 Tax=Ascaphus truei TaxID=8439 RepID=UPI003F5A7BD4